MPFQQSVQFTQEVYYAGNEPHEYSPQLMVTQWMLYCAKQVVVQIHSSRPSTPMLAMAQE